VRAGCIRDAKTGPEIVRVGDAVQYKQQRGPGERIEQVVEAFLPARVFDSRDDALVPAAGVHAVQSRNRHPHELHAMDLASATRSFARASSRPSSRRSR
jgi:hypothetical protein